MLPSPGLHRHFAAAALVVAVPAAALAAAGCGDDAAGSGGAGGAAATGTTGTSKGDIAATSVTGSSGNGTGQGGGSPLCVGPEGRGFTIDACDKTNLGSLGLCPETSSEPVGLVICQQAHELYTQGSWENLLACLGELPATYDEACVEPMASENVDACIDEVVFEACPNPTAEALCGEIGAQCEAAGESFALDACKTTLAPFNDASIASYDECIQAASRSLACESLHAECVIAL